MLRLSAACLGASMEGLHSGRFVECANAALIPPSFSVAGLCGDHPPVGELGGKPTQRDWVYIRCECVIEWYHSAGVTSLVSSAKHREISVKHLVNRLGLHRIIS